MRDLSFPIPDFLEAFIGFFPSGSLPSTSSPLRGLLEIVYFSSIKEPSPFKKYSLLRMIILFFR